MKSPAITRTLALLLVSVVLASGCANLMADTVEELIKRGIELLTAGKYDEAISKFLEAVRRDPKAWNGYLYLARAYVAKGSWSDAIASGRKALELAPNNGDVVSALAQALLGAGVDAFGRRQFGEAIGHLREYITLRPADVQGYLQLGRAFLGNGNFTDALGTFVQGLGKAPDATARQSLLRGLLDGGVQALNSGNAKGAIGLLQEYVRHDGGNVSAYLNLGKAYWQDGSLPNALGAFRRVLELNPSDPEALQVLGGRR